MPPTSILGFFGCLAVLTGLAWTPLLSAADVPPTQTKGRNAALDGLRGFLALGVFFHHALIYRKYASSGIWERPTSHFFEMLGPVAVALFFMITGYLFWGKLLADNGRPDWTRLYVGRAFRIGPLYLVATGTMLAAVAAITHLRLQIPLTRLAAEVGRWLFLGISQGTPEVNGYPDAKLILAGLTWTIHYEWIFYFSLVPLAMVARYKRYQLAVPAGALVLCLILSPSNYLDGLMPSRTMLASYFLAGMVSASIDRQRLKFPLLSSDSWWASLVTAGLLVLAFLPLRPYSRMSAVALGCAFWLISSGCSLFGLLKTQPAKRLGDVSYGIYLLQGLVLSACFNLPVVKRLALHSSMGYWAAALGMGSVLILLALLAHVAVELPGTRAGKRSLVWISSHTRHRPI